MIVGVDYSTRAVDLVKIPFEGDAATWKRVVLEGARADERVLQDARRKLRELGGTWWDDVALVALERPAGHGTGAVIDMAVVAGVVLSRIPARIPVWRFSPGEWRKACGLKGNATKYEVALFATKLRLEHAARAGIASIELWPQDASDAYAIAIAARTINDTQQIA